MAVPMWRTLVKARVIAMGSAIIFMSARAIVTPLIKSLLIAWTFVASLETALARRSRRPRRAPFVETWRAPLFGRGAIVALHEAAIARRLTG